MTAGMNDEQIEQMSKTMFRFCLSRTGSYHDAEDLAQEILLIACRSTNYFENEKAFYAFVWKTAGNILSKSDTLSPLFFYFFSSFKQERQKR